MIHLYAQEEESVFQKTHVNVDTNIAAISVFLPHVLESAATFLVFALDMVIAQITMCVSVNTHTRDQCAKFLTAQFRKPNSILS